MRSRYAGAQLAVVHTAGLEAEISFDPGHPHYDYHVHRASAEMIEAGLRPEKAATINRDFASYEEALQYFLRTTNITDASAYFADFMQGDLPFPDEEPTQ